MRTKSGSVELRSGPASTEMNVAKSQSGSLRVPGPALDPSPVIPSDSRFHRARWWFQAGGEKIWRTSLDPTSQRPFFAHAIASSNDSASMM